MEPLIKIFIIIHATFGGIALVAGFIAMIAKKGLKTHKISGIVFYYTMLTSAITAMLISFLPNHHSPFLFAIGIFSTYFIITGKRALRFKNQDPNLFLDKWICRIMIFSGILMIFLPVLFYKNINIILSVFAIVGIIFSTRDLVLYKTPERLRKVWLKLHLGKMIGAYISATTAFVVVNGFIPGIYGWFIPGIIGGFVIVYWSKKVDKTKMFIIKKP